MAETYFKRVFKGYDPQQVDEFITNLSDTYEQNEKSLSDRVHVLETENERLLSQISELNVIAERTSIEHENELIEKQAEYEAKCAEIGEKMVVADKRAAEIVRSAEKEAALILTHARQNSENEAKVIRLRAEDEASRLIEETRRKCETLSLAAEEFRARQDEMNRSIFETEKRFGDALSRLREGLGDKPITD